MTDRPGSTPPDLAATVVVLGDVAIDWFSEVTRRSEAGPIGWQRAPGITWSCVRGGAWLNARMIEARMRASGTAGCIHPPWYSSGEKAPLRIVTPQDVLLSFARVEAFPRIHAAGLAARALRVRRYNGYEEPRRHAAEPPGFQLGPAISLGGDAATGCAPVPWTTIAASARQLTLVFDDAGSHFRRSDAVRSAVDAIGTVADQWLVLKLSRPLADAAGSDILAITAASADRTVVIVTGASLRDDGIDISNHLSWDRTLADIARHFQEAPNNRLAAVARCRFAVILLGVDAAVIHDRVTRQLTLLFDPERAEGDFARLCREQMPGATTAIVATIAAHVAVRRIAADQLAEAVTEGLRRARLLLLHGFVRTGDGELDFPIDAVFDPPATELAAPGQAVARALELRPGDVAGLLAFSRFTLPMPLAAAASEFSILHRKIIDSGRSTEIFSLARRLVLKGWLDDVPCARIGKLTTFDHAEAEAYRAIANVMAQYRKRHFSTRANGVTTPRPISFAVLGPPGAGKSLGVSQIAQEIFGGDCAQLTFNLAQFTSSAELAPAFHRIRDVYLGGRLPFVLFDEFDSKLGSDELGWLRHFLAPMQDGDFLDHGHIHPIGAAVFVFAGGTRSSLAQFQDYFDERQPPPAYGDKFRNAKGPDFVSRLRGHVDLRGINKEAPNDPLWMIRRAAALRESLRQLAPGLVADDHSIAPTAIAENVMSAFLRVERYRHGVRSLRAVIEMSALADRDRFVAADLPSDSNLSLHVSADFKAVLDKPYDEQPAGD